MKIIECPRDAMQGIKEFIPTEKKVQYINQLLSVGFDTIDFGSFVSPKAIPQMRDTAQVLSQLHLEGTSSKLLAIVANTRGAEDACSFDEIQYVGYPFSISATFQQRNTNSTIKDSLKRVEEIQALCQTHSKELVVYLSMAFGNPYGDPWSPEIAADWGEKLHNDLGVRILALSDTTGSSDKQNITDLFSHLIKELPEAEIGAHLHTVPHKAKEKVVAALQSGCQRFDAAIRGFGGCPMAKEDLTGNMATETLIETLTEDQRMIPINEEALAKAIALSQEIFP